MSIPSSSAIALGLVIAAIAATSGLANSGGSDTIQCGIAESHQNGMQALEGTLTSPVAVSGEYRFAIQSASNGGSSNISQGGFFSANANEITTLGKVMLNSGAKNTVVFDVTVDGKKIDCNQALTHRL
ncbi:hypothetical protein SAMN05428969_1423 [Devosia sp. YR412]|uniref:curli-like amyloid fiber formation chaperone CsgH n=1 Tax=Devosia sp. YR412 TaxID=1881030 RepID=UPI0008CE1D86|nr:curli-like amyloid fiber formation chaperone CsgH [Devosia sp. YR412]SEP98764.1 hypothetical protein SAMN05428969_1423 [Devosia sp. YR412]